MIGPLRRPLAWGAAFAALVPLAAGALVVGLPNRDVDEVGVEPALATKLRDPAMAGHVPALVQLERIPLRAERARLAEAGLELGRYVETHAWFARIRVGTDLSGLEPAVRWAGLIRPEDRISPALWAMLAPGIAAPARPALVQVSFEPGTKEQGQREILRRHGARAELLPGGAWLVAIGRDDLLKLAVHEDVLWVEPVPAGAAGLGPSPLPP